MKQKSLVARVWLILGAALSTSAFATGTVSSEVKDDIAYVYHKDAHWNCCPDTVMQVIPNPDTAFIIDIFERDLCTHPCNCMCYFDLTHTLEGLVPGTYTARVWEVFCENQPMLAGTTDFVIPAQAGLKGFSSAMSDCHEEPGASEDKSPKTETFLTTASQVTAQSVEISYSLVQTSEVALGIYNSVGIKICRLHNGAEGPGTHIAIWNATDDSGNKVSPGTYFVLLETYDKIISLSLIVLK
jgi:hypothetical protein